MAKIVGCWAGCHGMEGGGGKESIEGIITHTAPTLSAVLPLYDDEELVRLIRFGVKRDGRSAVGMISFVFWSLSDQDLVNIIAHLRKQPALPPVPRKLELPFRGRLALATGKWKVSAEQVDRSRPRWGELPRTTSFERGRYYASITCAECHGVDYQGNELEEQYGCSKRGNKRHIAKPGGVLISNDAVLEIPEIPLRSAGNLAVPFSDRPGDGERMVWYVKGDR